MSYLNPSEQTEFVDNLSKAAQQPLSVFDGYIEPRKDAGKFAAMVSNLGLPVKDKQQLIVNGAAVIGITVPIAEVTREMAESVRNAASQGVAQVAQL